MYLAKVYYFDTKSKKRMVTMYSNKGTSKFPFFILFFKLLLCCPMTDFWAVNAP